ncbi:hypothetical protein LTR70_010517 [Exophiala xenobiotica]|nr:hypothetical protein LTR70_010517 [Exophiala xenobiotica]
MSQNTANQQPPEEPILVQKSTAQVHAAQELEIQEPSTHQSTAQQPSPSALSNQQLTMEALANQVTGCTATSQQSTSPDSRQQIVNNQNIDADEDFQDEAYASSVNSSSLTSIASDVRRGVEENGRLYPSYGRNTYGMPVDEQELDRNDLQHAKFLLLLRDRLCLAPIDPSPTRILDVGTGTGIWAMDMGDVFPSAEVIGTDIAPVQPTWVPPNVQFVVEDAEDDWTFTPGTFNLVFGRELFMAIRDWPRFMSQAHTALKPGGWLELSASYPRTHCDDGSLDLKTSFYAQSVEIYYEIAAAMGTSLEAPRSWAQQMRDAGFVDVRERIFKMPMGPWAKDKRLKSIGVFELAQLNAGYEGYLLRGWTQALNRAADDLRILISEGRLEVNNPRHHTYCHL